MAVLENSKPKAEKTSASVTTTFPRLCPTSKVELKDTSGDHQKIKKQSPRNSSNENKEGSGAVDLSKINFEKSNVIETLDLNKSTKNNSKDTSGTQITPRNYHGQIPVLSRHSLNFFKMSPPVTRSPSPFKRLNQKEKSSNKIKTITLEEAKKKSKARNSRSPSPAKRAGTNGNKKPNSRTSSSPTAGHVKNSETSRVKRADSSKQASPRVNSPTKRKSKVFSSPVVELSVKNKLGKDLQRPGGDNNTIILKQTSQPSLFANEKIIQPQEKISLDHIKNEVYSGDHRRLSLEKVHLCIEQTVENFNLAERKRSYLVTYSSEDIKKQEEISLSFLKNMSSTNISNVSKDADQRILLGEVAESKAAIRTLSGHELILTPSMKLDIDKEENDCLEISKILQDQAESFEDKNDLHILQDDENEYDSEVSTDGEAAGRLRRRSFVSKKYDDPPSANSLWKSREADLLNDVDYRQSVYHPAVSRRQNTDDAHMDFGPKNSSMEETFGFPSHSGKRLVRTRSSHLNNKFESQCFTTDKSDTDRSWAPIFDKTDERQMYNSVIQDVPFYGEMPRYFWPNPIQTKYLD